MQSEELREIGKHQSNRFWWGVLLGFVAGLLVVGLILVMATNNKSTVVKNKQASTLPEFSKVCKFGESYQVDNEYKFNKPYGWCALENYDGAEVTIMSPSSVGQAVISNIMSLMFRDIEVNSYPLSTENLFAEYYDDSELKPDILEDGTTIIGGLEAKKYNVSIANGSWNYLVIQGKEKIYRIGISDVPYDSISSDSRSIFDSWVWL
ncbi:MAG: hypothetical protein Q7S64_01795 [bacterium]|nr:hypothetical protein [bacterium]